MYIVVGFSNYSPNSFIDNEFNTLKISEDINCSGAIFLFSNFTPNEISIGTSSPANL